MNILCISKYASPSKYGVAARLFYLAKEFVKQGHTATLLTSDSNHLASYPVTDKACNREGIDGVDVVWFKNRKYKKTASIARVLSWFSFECSLFRYPKSKLGSPDIIIVSSLSLLSIIYGWYLKRHFKVPLIFEVRDIWPLTLVAEGGVSRWHPLTLFLSMIEKFGYRKADLVVGTMPRLDKHVEKILGQPRPFFCSPLGFDEGVMKVRDVSEAPELDQYFPEGKTIVGYAGSMGISNNLDPFVDSIFALDREGDDFLHFVLVGAGDFRESFQDRLKHCSNVTFVPRIKAEKVPAFLNRCDILYLSTHDSEVWDYGQSMNKVVEYMYAGKPIIATYSGFPSMIDEAGSGVYVKSEKTDELRGQLKKFGLMPRDERKLLGEKGREWIMSHRPYTVLAEEYVKEINKLVKGADDEAFV